MASLGNGLERESLAIRGGQMALSNKQMKQRAALFQLWYLGSCAASGENRYGEPSTLAHVLFCPFIHAEHPHLRLNKEEIAVVETFDVAKMMPPSLRSEIQAKLGATSTETGLPKDLLLAAAWGYSTAKVNDKG